MKNKPIGCVIVALMMTAQATRAGETIHTGQLLEAEQAASSMRVPDGFHVTLFAGEPDVQQPIGFCIDDRGRLWVAEAYNYPRHGTRAGDRIVIFEDVDGDGRFDRRKVFFDQLNYVTGIEVGFGGVWVMSPPNFYFIPDRDGDDQPDGPPEVLLDGFGNHANAHNLANGFAWGPDGWLYGTHGRTNWSMLGKPGTPLGERTRFDGGVYRYHPVRHVWESYADGTTNPWGIDWNDYGESFICNCVNPHLFHVVQGAHYEPWRNRKSSQYAYQRIPTIADHLHFVGSGNIRDGLGSPAEDEAGGGHAHCGMMIYLGDNWPASYRNTLFTNNIHGRRINNDVLYRDGSGYRASHGPDVMRSNDPWFMGVTLLGGPAGEVYVSDWSDTGECHSIVDTHRQTGRIYRIAYGDLTRPQVDLGKLTDRQLVDLQLHANDWYVRHARRLLHERFAAGHSMSIVHRQLRQMLDQQTVVPRKLRALWALWVTDGIDETTLIDLLHDDSPYVRAWSVRLLCEKSNPSHGDPSHGDPSHGDPSHGDPSQRALEQFHEIAATGSSSLVRLHLASVMQRLTPRARWPICTALAARSEDSTDANLPLMLWYAIEPLVADDLVRFTQLSAAARIGSLRQNMARRVADRPDPGRGLDLLVSQLGKVGDDNDVQSDLLQGMLVGLEGHRQVDQPHGWSATYARLSTSTDARVRDESLRLALVFDDPVAMKTLRIQAANISLPGDVRNRAIDALAARRPDRLAPLLLTLIHEPAVRQSALRGLAQYDLSDTATEIIASYPSMDRASRQQALQTLASRTAWAGVLLDAVQTGQVDRRDLTAFTARQIQSLNDPRLTRLLQELWGEVRTTSGERRRRIDHLRQQLSAEVLSRADLVAGRAVFDRQCANCHRLFDAGGSIGPDLTGAQRNNVDYLLENIVDPSAAVARDYRMQMIETTDGRVLTGLVESENGRVVTLLTLNDRIVVPVPEIEYRQESQVSMMPDGLLNPLTQRAVRDLIAYLQSGHQNATRGK